MRTISSVVMVFNTNDTTIAAADLVDAKGQPRYTKYVPFPAFKTTIENYPYPYVINGLLWEMPFVAPSEYMAKKITGARLAVIPGAGHSSNLDQPEAFNRALREFLSGL